MSTTLAARLPAPHPRIAVVPRVTGLSLPVRAAEILASEAAMARLVDTACDILYGHGRIGVRLVGQDGGGARDSLAGICGLLDAAVARSCQDAASIEIAVDAALLDPEEAWRTRCDLLGEGPLYLVADNSLMKPGRSPDSARFWTQLWELRGTGAVLAAYAPVVNSPCPLLAAEPAAALQPLIGAQVPVGSAWVSVELTLTDFADERGEIQVEALQAALVLAVEVADAWHDRVHWATAQARHDAWLNRRLAIVLLGLGDLVVRRADDPRSLRCLRELAELCRWCKSLLHARSRSLADGAEMLPALRDSDPRRWLPEKTAHDDWQRCWRQAVAAHAVRHRNLLVMTPWSVLPSSGEAHAGYLDLLPLLGCADAVGFAGAPDLESWNRSVFINLHQRAHAVFERRNLTWAFAEQA